MAAAMEAQSGVAEDGFTQVAPKGGRRAKKRQAEELSVAGEGGMRAAWTPRRPVFPPSPGTGSWLGKKQGQFQSQRTDTRH